MATTQDIKNLEIACQLGKLVVEGNTSDDKFNEAGIRKLLLWYFLNKTKDKGSSPATEKVSLLSRTVKKILTQMSESEKATKVVLRLLLEIRREG